MRIIFGTIKFENWFSSVNSTEVFPLIDIHGAAPVLSLGVFVGRNAVDLNRLATKEIAEYWGRWEFRLMMTLSLVFQFLIIIMGYIRKKQNGGAFTFISTVVYLTYLLADQIATISLSTLLRADISPDRSAIVMLWTPFLLWHLGGPYNVTAYSLEDNQIWTRHLLNWLTHVGEAAYICFNLGRRTKHPQLRFLAAPILVAGAYKYALRVWALRSADEKQLADQLYFKEEGFLIKGIKWGDKDGMLDYIKKPKNDQIRFLRESYLSFMIFRCLFFGLPVRFAWSSSNKDILQEIIKTKETKEAFRVVDVQLLLLYDIFYTKIPIQVGNWSLFAFGHAVYLLFTIASLLAFYYITKMYGYVYGEAETFFTYVLLSGAILIETISSVLHLISTWTIVMMEESLIGHLVRKRLRSIVAGRRSISMGQHDFIEHCCSKSDVITSPVRILLVNLLGANHLFTILWNSKWSVIDLDIKAYIFDHLKADGNSDHLLKQPHMESSEVIMEILKRHGLNLDGIEITEEFVNFIFVFHIATNILYYIDDGSNYVSRSCKISKSLSDYMMYLALVRPLMLPKGIVDVLYKDTRNQLVKFVKSNQLQGDRTQFAVKFHNLDDHSLSLTTQDEKASSGGHKSTMLEPARRISRRLCPIPGGSDHQQRWDTICKVWMDMFAYAAVHCAWKEHAEHLREGGELLSHVALLMAHLGYAM